MWGGDPISISGMTKGIQGSLEGAKNGMVLARKIAKGDVKG